MITILNLNFEDSKKVILDRNSIIKNTEFQVRGQYLKRKYNIFHRFYLLFVTFWSLILQYGISIGVRSMKYDDLNFVNHLIGVKVAQVSNSLNYIILSVLIILLSLTILYFLVPVINYLYWAFSTLIIQTFWWISLVITIFPLLFGVLLGGWGFYSAVFMLIYIFLRYYIFLSNFIYKKISFLNNNYKNKSLSWIKNNSKWLLLISVIIGFIHSVIQFKSSFLFNYLFGFLFPIMYLLIMLILNPILKQWLTYYYLKKYSKQYRIFYEIPDEVWYLSMRRAKKHQHVYPVTK